MGLKDRGNVKAVLQEYADLMLPKDRSGKPQCQCIATWTESIGLKYLKIYLWIYMDLWPVST